MIMMIIIIIISINVSKLIFSWGPFELVFQEKNMTLEPSVDSLEQEVCLFWVQYLDSGRSNLLLPSVRSQRAASCRLSNLVFQWTVFSKILYLWVIPGVKELGIKRLHIGQNEGFWGNFVIAAI